MKFHLFGLYPQCPFPSMVLFFVSEDGVSARTDQGLGHTLSERRISVLDLNFLEDFWKTGTPDKASKELKRTRDHYLSSWTGCQPC